MFTPTKLPINRYGTLKRTRTAATSATLVTLMLALTGCMNIKPQPAGPNAGVSVTSQADTHTSTQPVQPVAVTPSKKQRRAEHEEGLRLAHLLRDNGRYQAAYAVYARMADKNELDGSLYIEFASLSSLVRPPQEALTQWGKALNLLGGDVSRLPALQQVALCEGMGRARLALGLIDLAEKDFQCVLKQQPHNVQALNALGVIKTQHDQLEAARALFNQAMAQDPGNIAALNNLSLTWLVAGEPEKAIRLLEQASTQGDISLQLNLALAFMLNHQDKAASDLLGQRVAADRVKAIMTRMADTRSRIENGMPASVALLKVSQQPMQLKEAQ